MNRDIAILSHLFGSFKITVACLTIHSIYSNCICMYTIEKKFKQVQLAKKKYYCPLCSIQRCICNMHMQMQMHIFLNLERPDPVSGSVYFQCTVWNKQNKKGTACKKNKYYCPLCSAVYSNIFLQVVLHQFFNSSEFILFGN